MDEKRKKLPAPPFPPLLVAQQSQPVEAAPQSKDKIMLLLVQRTHFEAIKAERKRWEGRPLF